MFSLVFFAEAHRCKCLAVFSCRNSEYTGMGIDKKGMEMEEKEFTVA